jgi:hypothetical protein
MSFYIAYLTLIVILIANHRAVDTYQIFRIDCIRKLTLTMSDSSTYSNGNFNRRVNIKPYPKVSDEDDSTLRNITAPLLDYNLIKSTIEQWTRPLPPRYFSRPLILVGNSFNSSRICAFLNLRF